RVMGYLTLARADASAETGPGRGRLERRAHRPRPGCEGRAPARTATGGTTPSPARTERYCHSVREVLICIVMLGSRSDLVKDVSWKCIVKTDGVCGLPYRTKPHPACPGGSLPD